MPDVLNAKEASHEFVVGNDRVRLSVVGARKVNNSVQLDVTVNGVTPMLGGFQQPRHPLMQSSQLTNSIRLVDAQGQTLTSGGYSSSGDGTQLTANLRYSLPREFVAPIPGQPPVQPAAPILAEPLKLIVDVPTDLVQTQVPFSFSNIPLP